MLTIVMIIILNVKTEKLNKKAVVSFIIFNVILVIMSGMLCYNRNNITANILTSAHGDVDIEVRTLKEGDKILQHEVKDINLFYIELLDSDRKSYKYSINKYYYTDYRNTITDCGDHISYVVFDK